MTSNIKLRELMSKRGKIQAANFFWELTIHSTRYLVKLAICKPIIMYYPDTFRFESTNLKK